MADKVIKEEKLAISLTADGMISITLPKDDFVKAVKESFAAANSGARIDHWNCEKVVPPCPRLSVAIFDRSLVERMLKADIIAWKDMT